MRQIILILVSLLLSSLSLKSQISEIFIEDYFLLYEEAWQNECLERDFEKELLKSNRLKKDTMSIYNLQCFWQFFKSDYQEEFVISSTNCLPGLNYGIYWPTGETVILPKNNWGNVYLDLINNNLSVIWSIKEKGKVEIRFFHLQDLKISNDKLPKRINVSSF